MHTTIYEQIEVSFDDLLGVGHISRFIKERNLKDRIII